MMSMDAIKPSKVTVTFKKELKTLITVSNANTAITAITPFIPLIGDAATKIVEVIEIREKAQYNKKICNAILDRARLAEAAIENWIRRREENEPKFKNQIYYDAFHRFVNVLDKLKTFAEKISQFKGIKFVKIENISERFDFLVKEYDEVMKDLNFTIAIANKQQRQIDQESLRDDLAETSKFLEKIDNGVEVDDAQISLIWKVIEKTKDIKNIRSMAKKIKSSELTDPDVKVRGEDDIRGIKPFFVRKKIYMKAIEVACKPIKNHEENTPAGKYELTILMKVSQSPNIIQFFGLSEVDSKTVMVLEWAQLGSLEEIYKKDRIPLKLKLTYALQICRGIAYLNALGIYHHNLRCKNVMVTENNVAKLANFKLARSIHNTTTSIKEGLESARWAAPEKLKIQHYNYDHRCEIFSFGMLLWELVFQKIPFEDMLPDNISDYVIEGGREKINFGLAAKPEVTKIQKGYTKIIKQAWVQDPEMRISISRLLIDLDTLCINPGLQLDSDIYLESENSYNNDDYDPKDEVDIEPLIPMSEGIKAHNEKDYEKAWKCFEKHANNNNRQGKHWKAYYLWEGFFVPKDKISAIKLHKEAADDGVAESQFCYAFGIAHKDVKVLNLDSCDSIKYLNLAAENDNANAQFHIGECYLKGKLCEKNLEVAIQWFKRSALNSNNKAIKKLRDLKVEI